MATSRVQSSSCDRRSRDELLLFCISSIQRIYRVFLILLIPLIQKCSRDTGQSEDFAKWRSSVCM